MPRRKNQVAFLQAKRAELEAEKETLKRQMALLIAAEREQAKKATHERRLMLGTLIDEAGLDDISPALWKHLFAIIAQLRQQTPNQLGLWIDEGLARLKDQGRGESGSQESNAGYSEGPKS
jgi:small-conductance mechanosensitive channel